MQQQYVLALSVTFCVFSLWIKYLGNGWAHLLCLHVYIYKFTWKMSLSLARTSLNVKVNGQRSRSPQGQKTRCALRQRANGMRSLQTTSRSSGRDHSVAAGGGAVISAACVRFMFGKTSLALVFIMVALCNRADHYIFALFLSFFFFSLPNLSGRRSDVYYTSTHGVALVRI